MIRSNLQAGACFVLLAAVSIVLCFFTDVIWARRVLGLWGILLLQCGPILAVAFGPERNDSSVLFMDYWQRRA